MAQKSLLLLTVDCFRADHAGFLGYHRPTTPFFDSLADESTVFSNAIVGGSPTYYSFPAIMSSRYPLALGRDVVGLAPGECTLAAVLRSAGYATAAFLAANPYLSKHFGYDAGFEVFRDFLDADAGLASATARDSVGESLLTRLNRRLAGGARRLGPLGPLYEELYFRYGLHRASSSPLSLNMLRRFPSADTLIDHALGWLQETVGRPFFLWLHFMDPHSPYYPRPEALRMMGDERLNATRARFLNSLWNRGGVSLARLQKCREEIIRLYDAGIRWVDTQACRLVEALRSWGAWDQSVLAVSADHGEQFLEHGGRYHAPSSVSEELVRVPLLLRQPGDKGGRKVSVPFSLLHLAPTLLQLLDVPAPEEFEGRPQGLENRPEVEPAAILESVFGCSNPFAQENRSRPRMLAVRESRYKLVLDFGLPGEQLFDLQSDPGELRPLPKDAAPGVRSRMLERARRHLAESVRARKGHLRLAARLRDVRLELGRRGDAMAVERVDAAL